MITLEETPDGAFRSLLPDGRDAISWHAALAGEIAAHLSPAHAMILSMPARGVDGIRWQAEAVAARRYAELSPPDRELLMRAVGVILSDIRRLAESGLAPAVARCWPALREIPDLGMLYAADGRPVLAGWGAARAATVVARGLLSGADDGRPFRPVPRPAWRLYGLAGATLAVLALVAGLLLPLLGWPRATVTACAADPTGLAALRAQAQADARHNALLGELARLVAQQGALRLQCPIPAASTAPHPPALPQDAWNRHDLGMLAGCWTKLSNLIVQRESDSKVLGVASWKLCFDPHGTGTQTLVLDGGGTCTGSMQATFQDDKLVIHTERCAGPTFGGSLVPMQQVCTRLSDNDASCIGHNLEGDHQDEALESRFRR